MPQNLYAGEHLKLALEQIELLKDYQQKTSFTEYMRSREKRAYVKELLSNLTESINQAGHREQFLKTKYKEVDWLFWKKLRNKCVHQWWKYTSVHNWGVGKQQIPKLEKELKKILRLEPSLLRTNRIEYFEREFKRKEPDKTYEEFLNRKRVKKKRGRGLGL